MGSPLVTLGLLLLLVATMITIGTALTGQGLTAMLRRPRALVAAMAVNVVVVPAAAVAVVHGLALDGPAPTGSCWPPPRPSSASSCWPTAW
ncbi:hypothetical protein [Nonomuraea sp. KM88]|uniref:hypothetical protein n=1 Tax=Nonomuraea sp. KM88 TaxID=3457427 RepID=UPI003FCD8631